MNTYLYFKLCTLRPLPLFNYIYNYYRIIKVHILSLFTRYSTETFFPLTVRNTVGAEQLIYDTNWSLSIVIYLMDKASFTPSLTHSLNQSINQSISQTQHNVTNTHTHTHTHRHTYTHCQCHKL